MHSPFYTCSSYLYPQTLLYSRDSSLFTPNAVFSHELGDGLTTSLNHL